MKLFNKLTYFIALAGIIFLGSCAEEDEFLLKDEFLHFDRTATSVLEGGTTTFDIIVAAGNRTNAVNVTMNVEATNMVQGTDYTVTGDGTVSLDANTYQTTVTVTILNNEDVNTEDRNLVITLASNDRGYGLGYPGPDALFSTVTVTVNDNDCPSELSVTDAATSGEVTSSASSLALAEGDDPRMIITMTEGANGVYTVSDLTGGLYPPFVESLLGAGVGGNFVFPGTLIETCTGISASSSTQTYFGLQWDIDFNEISFTSGTTFRINWFIVDNPGVNDAFEPTEAFSEFTIP